jgi:hypothetical protein
MNYEGDNYVNTNFFDICIIDDVINKLHVGKAAGLDQLLAENLKYSHPILISILKRLFNLLLKTNYVPNAFGIGLTIPIPKVESNCRSLCTDDFRGITISPVISKVFEHCLLKVTSNYLLTSDSQFGFKKDSSCTHAIYTVRSTVNYFTVNNSTVNLCAIDISKAFDKANNHALLLKLMDRNVPRKFVLLLLYWYSKMFVTVKWKSYFSESVKLTAGVRQGGILSPYLFAIYVDNLLIKLKKSKFGCHIAGMCLNAIMYADDLLLLAISLRDLQMMVDLCVEEFESLDLKINIKKSACLRIGRNHDEKIASVVINNEALDWKQEMRYLGVFFVSANSFKCNLQLSRQKYFKALNGIFAKIGTSASPRVILSLVNSFCLPVLLYGIEAFPVNAKMFNCLENAFKTAFAKIFSTFDKTVILNCQYFCGVLPLCYTLDCRMFQFYSSLINSCNECVKLHFIRSGSKVFEQLLNKYSVASTDSLSKFKSVIWTIFKNSLNL